MATRALEMPPEPRNPWRWTAELDGDANRCSYLLSRDGLLIVRGSIEAEDGAMRGELVDHRIGETPQDLANLHSAWQWALVCCRDLMLAAGGQVHWQPYPDPTGGMG